MRSHFMRIDRTRTSSREILQSAEHVVRDEHGDNAEEESAYIVSVECLERDNDLYQSRLVSYEHVDTAGYDSLGKYEGGEQNLRFAKRK